MINRPVLVLNQSYEPLNVCHVRRAIVLIYNGKAEMLENGVGFIHSSSDIFPIPSVIKLEHMIKRPRPEIKFTRLGVFHRDNHTCQYCGQESRELTLDHIIPRYRGGEHTWENVVSACVPCNRHKAGRTPEQARMKLIHQPSRPRGNTKFFISPNHQKRLSGWQKYLPQ